MYNRERFTLLPAFKIYAMYARYTEEEDQLIRHFYALGGRHLAYKMLQAEGYNRTLKAVATRAKILKVKAPGNGCFVKGHDPINKGQSMDAETRKKVKHTWFPKCHQPHNTKHDGAISLRRDSQSGIYYKYIRVSLSKWVPYHRWLWENKHGKIPRNKILRFKDGNQANTDISNLELISRKEHLDRNNKDGLPSTRLTDGYVRFIIRAFKGFAEEDITPELIELYRQQLLLKRTISQIENDK